MNFASCALPFISFRPPPESSLDSFRLMQPGLYLLLDLRQKSQRHETGPKHRKNQAPRDQRAKVILARLVVADQRPDDNHDESDAGQGDNEHREHPKPD